MSQGTESRGPVHIARRDGELLYIAHRVNTREQLERTPREYGVELDLRAEGSRLILQHDAFLGGEDFEDYLAAYDHAFIILNIKCERIEDRVLEMMAQRGITEYMLLDSSFPMIRKLSAGGERRIAVRFSEYEPIEGVLALAGQVDWVWIDCFTRCPLDAESHTRLRTHFKLCLVSPELQAHPLERIAEFAAITRRFPVDAVCTKRPDLWREALG
jgi:hypothetical protein